MPTIDAESGSSSPESEVKVRFLPEVTSEASLSRTGSGEDGDYSLLLYGVPASTTVVHDIVLGKGWPGRRTACRNGRIERFREKRDSISHRISEDKCVGRFVPVCRPDRTTLRMRCFSFQPARRPSFAVNSLERHQLDNIVHTARALTACATRVARDAGTAHEVSKITYFSTVASAYFGE